MYEMKCKGEVHNTVHRAFYRYFSSAFLAQFVFPEHICIESCRKSIAAIRDTVLLEDIRLNNIAPVIEIVLQNESSISCNIAFMCDQICVLHVNSSLYRTL